MKDNGPAFSFGESFLGCRPFIGRIEDGMPLIAMAVVSRERCVCAPLPDQHQRFINGNAGHPGCKSRVAAKSVEVCESTLKRSLSNILRILLNAKYPQGGAMDSQSITLVQYSESA